MIDYIAAIEAESTRFAELIRTVDPDTPVPSCAGWNLSDLAWHLAEVQYFWASIASDLLLTPEGMAELARPNDNDLHTLFVTQSARLVDALASHEPDVTCWSWHERGHSIGWLRRRQAHEALIHRVDAELTAGTAFSMDAELSADGVDEVLTVMVDASSIPDWSSFNPDDRTASIAADGGGSWDMLLGRFTGTSPNTGNSYDDPALLLAPVDYPPTVSIRGSGPDLNLWLWGRGSVDTLSVRGNSEGAADIRAAAAVGTQ